MPSQSHQLTPVQTALQQLSEKHPDIEIQPINTIQPPEIECTQISQALVPTDTPQINYQKAYTMTVRHRQNCQKYRIMRDPWIRITNPGTRSHKSISNINTL